ncbi:MAG: Polyketide cyclase [Frankiales bacterium]|nr:Polyketide cyclase [Frankiales bacterium]
MAAGPTAAETGRMAVLTLTVDVDAPVEATWRAAVDWESQGEWVLGTTVRATAHDGVGVGGGLEAFTGVGRIGFLDTMVITVWEPPHRCEVLHTGRVVRGTGVFAVEERPGGRSRFVWEEQLALPLGIVGRMGWPLVRPLFAAGVQRSLKRFAVQVAAKHP